MRAAERSGLCESARGWPVGARRGPVRADRALIGGLSGGLGRQNPDSCRTSESTADEVAQVESGGTACEPGVVLGGAAVAEFQAATTAAGDLRDERSTLGRNFRYFSPSLGFSAQSRRAWRSRSSRGCRTILRPVLDLVHRSRRGQSRHSAPKVATRVFSLIGRVLPAGQLTVPACSSTVKSSTVNPPSTGACSGFGARRDRPLLSGPGPRAGPLEPERRRGGRAVGLRPGRRTVPGGRRRSGLGWEELGHALASFEGWRFRLVIDDPAEDLRPDAQIVMLGDHSRPSHPKT